METRGRWRQYIMGGGMIFLCLILTCAALGFTESADVNALDDALKRIGSADSLTIRIRITLTQNSLDRLRADVIFQVDQERAYFHASLVDDTGKTRNVEIASSEGMRIIRDGDAFYSMQNDLEDGTLRSLINPETLTVDQLRKSLKALIGSAIDKLTITNDGLSLHLTKGEIPFFLGLAVGFADGYEIKEEEAGGFVLPLGYGLYIDHIDLNIPVEDGSIGDIQAEAALGGRSRDGASLITSIVVDCSFSDIDSTTPETVDTTGIELRPLEQK